ncbi:PDZ domain-containing protein [Bacillus sp. A301a_S52]|nr:PDZ domain-containing protein [Bacillus sp. A301a_S52]
MDVIGFEILKAVGRFFLHPLTYVMILAIFWYNLRRVKRERKDFHTRVYDLISYVVSPLGISLIFTIIVSIVTLLLGIHLQPGFLILISLLWVLLVPFSNARWLSMTTIVSLGMLITFFLPELTLQHPLVNSWLNDLRTTSLLNVALLITVLFITEAILVLLDGWKKTSPAIIKSKRGKLIGEHLASRFWFIPVFLIVPVGELTDAGWWPVLDIPGTFFGIALLPFVLGFRLNIHAELPVLGVKRVGKQLLLVALAVIPLATIAYFYPLVAVIIPVVVLIARELIFVLYHWKDKGQTSFFARREDGLRIVGVLPGSTAAKMGLEIGEIIVKANGREVYSQRSFYDALQQNSAYCKLEVLDTNGELRFAQSSIFQGDHFQIGCLFVPDDEFGNLSYRGLRSSVVINQDRSELTEHEKENDSQEHREDEEVTREFEEDVSTENEKTSSVDGDHVSESHPIPSQEEVVDKEAFFKSAKDAYETGKPYGQAEGLSSFYDEFRKMKSERNKWRPKMESDIEEQEEKKEYND